MSEANSLGARRILDACANRASEGLRTLEEFARFVLEDRFITQTAKQLRHDLHAAMQSIALPQRFTARAVTSDCGTTLQTSSEMTRADLGTVIQAAAGRTQEALRCIEEYGKTVDGFDSPRIEAIRYRTYSLAAALLLNPSKVSRLANAKLYLLIETNSDLNCYAEQVEAYFNSGVDLIQLRDKQAADRRLYECAKIAADIARRVQKVFIVNDRADIALAVQASGVHVGQDELPVEAARRVVGTELLIGVSTHTIEQARTAVLQGADYLGCGPTFPSQTKSFEEFPGLDFLKQVATEISLPAFAIGGIDEGNFTAVMQTGIHGVAMASAILNAREPTTTAGILRAAM